MTDEYTSQSTYPKLNKKDQLVIVMDHHEPDAFIQVWADRDPVELELKAFNVIDSRDGDLAGPGLDETPIDSDTLTINPGGTVKRDLRPLGTATQFNKVTLIDIVSGEARLTIASPTRFNDYIRQPARTSIET